MTTPLRPEYGNLGFDPDALREKYRHERDKRLRPEGNDQYVEVTGTFAHFVDDPYVPPLEREPLDVVTDTLIVGGGFGGLLTGARFREAGLDDFRIIESGGDFGGTWYWNRYPGAQCDIESYCYLPLLEELGYIPKEKYAYAPEILEHSQRIANAYDLYSGAIFQTQVTELRWHEDDARWHVTTDRNDRIRARFVVLCTGPLNRPKLPAIQGIDEFAGHTFHTSRWDYAYTGGDHGGGLHKLADKRVAVIGTGATAIQCVPYVGKHAQQLYVFQRTPSSVDVRGNSPTDAEWARQLTPGWQRTRRENFNDMVTGRPVEKDLVADGWTEIFRDLAGILPREQGTPMSPEEAAELAELADFRKMNKIRARVDSTVADAARAEALKPWYRQFCKRPTFNDEYLPTFNRANVTLVDTSDSAGVDRITATGVVANGIEYEVDCIIFATGFEVGTAYTRRSGFEIHGEDGERLTDHWAQGTRTLHGFASSGFPNIFLTGFSQNGVSVNLTSVLDDQAQHIAYIVGEVQRRGLSSVQPTREAEAEWVATIHRLAMNNRDFLEACTPGYYNNEGQLSGDVRGLAGDQYAPGANAFNRLIGRWREDGRMEGMVLK